MLQGSLRLFWFALGYGLGDGVGEETRFTSDRLQSFAAPSDRRLWIRHAAIHLLNGVLICSLSGGCVTHQKRIDQARLDYWQGNFEAAQTGLNQALKRPKKDADVLKLDQAMIRFSKGDLRESSELLREVRDHFDQVPVAGHAQKATSYLMDDNSRPYQGEDHEKILLRVMLTLIDLVEQNGDAVAYAHQVGQSIDQMLIEREAAQVDQAAQAAKTESAQPADSADTQPVRPSASVATGHQVPATGVQTNAATPAPIVSEPPPDVLKEELAIAPLLRALVRKSSRLDHDEVQRNLKVAMEWRPQSAFLRQELVAAVDQRDVPPGYGSVYLIMLVGRGPVKQSVSEPVTSHSLLIADQILSAVGEYSLPPTLAPVKIAAMEPSVSNVDGMLVSTGGQVVGVTETIADLNRLAVARHQEQLPEIIARAVVRRVVKKAVVVATKAQTEVRDDLTSTAYNLAGVLWEASEKADLRCWSLLPGQIQILRVDLPVGTHGFELYPTLGGQVARPQPMRCTVRVHDGLPTFAVGTLLDTNHAGAIHAGTIHAGAKPAGTSPPGER